MVDDGDGEGQSEGDGEVEGVVGCRATTCAGRVQGFYHSFPAACSIFMCQLVTSRRVLGGRLGPTGDVTPITDPYLGGPSPPARQPPPYRVQTLPLPLPYRQGGPSCARPDPDPGPLLRVLG